MIKFFPEDFFRQLNNGMVFIRSGGASHIGRSMGKKGNREVFRNYGIPPLSG